MKIKIRKYFILLLCCSIFLQTVRANMFETARDAFIKKASEKAVEAIYARHPKLATTLTILGIGSFAVYEYREEISNIARKANEKITGNISIKGILQPENIVNMANNTRSSAPNIN